MKRIIRGIKKTAQSGSVATRRRRLGAKVHTELKGLDARLGEVNERIRGFNEPPQEFWDYRRKGETHKLHPTYVEFMNQRASLKDERTQLDARRKTLLARLNRIETAGKKQQGPIKPVR